MSTAADPITMSFGDFKTGVEVIFGDGDEMALSQIGCI
jgi:hypothetical protein